MAKTKSKKSNDKHIHHKKLCKVCKHKDLKEIEEKYHNYISPYDLIVDYPDLTTHNIYTHVNYFGLDLKRDKNIKAFYRRVMDKGFSAKVKVTEKGMLKASELLSKTNKDGELVDKQETKHDVSDRVAKQMANLMKKIGGTPNGASEEDISQ